MVCHYYLLISHPTLLRFTFPLYFKNTVVFVALYIKFPTTNDLWYCKRYNYMKMYFCMRWNSSWELRFCLCVFLSRYNIPSNALGAYILYDLLCDYVKKKPKVKIFCQQNTHTVTKHAMPEQRNVSKKHLSNQKK